LKIYYLATLTYVSFQKTITKVLLQKDKKFPLAAELGQGEKYCVAGQLMIKKGYLHIRTKWRRATSVGFGDMARHEFVAALKRQGDKNGRIFVQKGICIYSGYFFELQK
jgi:hypothetical protein